MHDLEDALLTLLDLPPLGPDGVFIQAGHLPDYFVLTYVIEVVLFFLPGLFEEDHVFVCLQAQVVRWQVEVGLVAVLANVVFDEDVVERR